MSTVPKFAEVNVGDSIPALLGAPISRLQLALFASAACDHNPIHVDDDAAKAAKLDCAWNAQHGVARFLG